MSILERMQRIVRANFDRLLDRVETPEQELEQHLVELEKAFEDGREAAASQGAHLARLEREARQLAEQRDQQQARAEQAVRLGDDEAARSALGRRARLLERGEAMAPALEQARSTDRQLRDALGQLHDQLQAGRQRLSELRARKRLAEARRAFDSHAALGDSQAGERLEDEVLQAEARADVREDMRLHGCGGAELEQQTRRLEVEAELAELKRRMNPGS